MANGIRDISTHSIPFSWTVRFLRGLAQRTNDFVTRYITGAADDEKDDLQYYLQDDETGEIDTEGLTVVIPRGRIDSETLLTALDTLLPLPQRGEIVADGASITEFVRKLGPLSPY